MHILSIDPTFERTPNHMDAHWEGPLTLPLSLPFSIYLYLSILHSNTHSTSLLWGSNDPSNARSSSAMSILLFFILLIYWSHGRLAPVAQPFQPFAIEAHWLFIGSWNRNRSTNKQNKGWKVEREENLHESLFLTLGLCSFGPISVQNKWIKMKQSSIEITINDNSISSNNMQDLSLIGH